MSEEQLINEIKSNPDLFGSVYDNHYQTIFNYCYKRTKDFNASKDITSETFLKAFLNIHKFKWKGVSLLSWLYRIATNEINLYYRSQKYKPKLLSETYNDFLIYSNSTSLDKEQESAEKELEKHKQFLSIQKELKKLALKYQEVISLKYFEKLKIKEISAILNKKEGTVKSLLSRAISKLKEKL